MAGSLRRKLTEDGLPSPQAEPAPYAQSRSALRDRFGTRTINASAPMAAGQYVSPAAAVGSDATRGSDGLTNSNDWANFFKPRIASREQAALAVPSAASAVAGLLSSTALPSVPFVQQGVKKASDPMDAFKGMGESFAAFKKDTAPENQLADFMPLLQGVIERNKRTIKSFGAKPNGLLAKQSTWDIPAY